MSEELIEQVKQLIITALRIEGMTTADIETDAPLFGEGLGLDSIDALELGMALEERFGVHLEDDSEANREIFASVRSLAAFVVSQRDRNGGPAA